MKSKGLYFVIVALIGALVSLFVTGCVAGNNIPNDTEPTAMQLSVGTASAATQTPVPIQSPVSTLTVQDVESIIYNENYLKGCKSNYPITHTEQAGFQEVYPGVTTKDELIAQFGQPNSVSALEQKKDYVYFDAEATYSYHFFVANNVVYTIHVNPATETLQTILEKYGCPDVIAAAILSGDLFDANTKYNATYFQYLKAGVLVMFDGYPINYSDIPRTIVFEEPSSLNSFLEKRGVDSRNPKLVSFSEAVVNK